ncbi:MAG: type III ribulose-bisphosphate carboxylase [Candidatus Anstonellales archaeon]
MGFEWYKEFVDKDYKPKKTDILVHFTYEKVDELTVEDAIGRIASESSIGTWTTLTLLSKRIRKMMAKVYSYDEKNAYIAYPLELWEKGSIPNLLSGIAGNIFGMKALKNLRLIDTHFPKEYVKEFKGPCYGIDVIKKIFKRDRGPVTATVPKPKIGFTSEEHAKIAFDLWEYGIDCVKDDENLASQAFNKFDRRVKLLAKMRDKAEKITGEVKEAFINVTAPNLYELERRIELIHDYGFKYFMIDIVISGFTALQTAAFLAHEYKMAIHGHRAMHAMFTRNHLHGMSMFFLAKLCRLIGIDQIHTGTVIGKLEGKIDEILAMRDLLLSKEFVSPNNQYFNQKWFDIKPILPVVSGGLHPGILPDVMKIYETDNLVLQVGGGVMGHPMGVKAGAKAVKDAIIAYHDGYTLEEYAKKSKELAEALKKWGYTKPV